MIAKRLARTRKSIMLLLQSLSFSSKVLFTRNTYDAIPKVQVELTYFPAAPAETSKNHMKANNFQNLRLYRTIFTKHAMPLNGLDTALEKL